ncbi:MAG: class I SAM-dependent methyltransferase [Acidobacteriota bacterium]
MKTVEAQYQHHLLIRKRHGTARLGIEKNGSWHDDPRRLVFVLSRYKFVARMLSGRDRVLEIGCGDAWPARIVLQEVKSLHAVDIDPVFIRDAEERMDPRWPFTVAVHDMLTGPVLPPFDAAYCLDVIEHIAPENERSFLQNAVDSLRDTGVLIIGTPSLQSQRHASRLSKIGHVNCKDAHDLRSTMEKFFHSVFIFSMNDEVVHTGFPMMAHYYFALCAHKKRRVDNRGRPPARGGKSRIESRVTNPR